MPDFYMTSDTTHVDGLVSINNIKSDPSLAIDATWIVDAGLSPTEAGDAVSFSHTERRRNEGY